MRALRKFAFYHQTTSAGRGCSHWPARLFFGLLSLALLAASSPSGISQTAAPSQDWQMQIRKYAEKQDWNSALRVVDQEISRAPEDMDVRAWRARILVWSGNLAEAEKEYLKILSVSRNDPDNWMGLANIYSREGRTSEA